MNRKQRGRWFSCDTESGICWGLAWGDMFRHDFPDIAQAFDIMTFPTKKEALGFYESMVKIRPELKYLPSSEEIKKQMLISHYAQKYSIPLPVSPLSPVRKLSVPRFLCYTEYTAEQLQKGLDGDFFQAFQPVSKGYVEFVGDSFECFFQNILTVSRKENVIISFHNLGYDQNVIYSNFYEKINELLEKEAAETECRLNISFLPDSTRTDKYICIHFSSKDKKKKHGCIRILDSNNIIHNSLQNVGEKASMLYGTLFSKMGDGQNFDYVNIVNCPKDIAATEEEKNYCYNDCMLAFFGILDAVFPFHKELVLMKRNNIRVFPFTLTQVSKIVADCRTIEKNLLKHGEEPTPKKVSGTAEKYRRSISHFTEKVMPPDADSFELIHKAAGGGFIATPIGVDGVIWRNVHTFDWSSLYPAKALDSLYPCDELKECNAQYFFKLWEIIRKRKIYIENTQYIIDDPNIGCGSSGGFFKIRLQNVLLRDRLNLIPYFPTCKIEELSPKNMQYHNKIVQCESGVFYLTHVDLLLMHLFYTWEDMQFIKGYSVKMGYLHPILRERFISCSDIKINAKKVNNEIQKRISKKEEYLTLSAKENVGLSAKYSDIANSELSEKWYHGKKAMLNAQYGLLYQKPIHLKRIGMHTVEEDNYTPKNYPFTIGMFVAQWGRFANAMQLLYWDSLGCKIVYAHTDSAKVIGNIDFDAELKRFNEGITSKVFFRDKDEFINFNDIAPGVGKLEEEKQHFFQKFITIGNMKSVGFNEKNNEIDLSITMSGLSESKMHDLLQKEIESGKSFEKTVDKYLSPGVFYDLQYGLAPTYKLIPDFSNFMRDLGWIKCCQSLNDSSYCFLPEDSTTAKKNKQCLKFYNIPNGWKVR